MFGIVFLFVRFHIFAVHQNCFPDKNPIYSILNLLLIHSKTILSHANLIKARKSCLITFPWTFECYFYSIILLLPDSPWMGESFHLIMVSATQYRRSGGKGRMFKIIHDFFFPFFCACKHKPTKRLDRDVTGEDNLEFFLWIDFTNTRGLHTPPNLEKKRITCTIILRVCLFTQSVQM